MNKKAFTLVELITTFAVASVILIFLINIVLSIKDIYTKSQTKTNLLIEQANLSKAMNSKFKNGNLKNYSKCDLENVEECYEFTFNNSEKVRLELSKSKIKFGDYIYKLDKNSKVSYFDLKEEGDHLFIKISINNSLYSKDDFGVNIVYFDYISEGETTDPDLEMCCENYCNAISSCNMLTLSDITYNLTVSGETIDYPQVFSYGECEIELSEGEANYNCSSFFTIGSVNIIESVCDPWGWNPDAGDYGEMCTFTFYTQPNCSYITNTCSGQCTCE